MVSGHLQEKNGKFHIVLTFNDEFGKRKTKWKATGLPVKGNKKRAEALLVEARRTLTPEKPQPSELLFADFLEKWLEVVKSSIELTTYASYCTMVKRIISPYFRERNILLSELQAVDIQDFYTEQLKRVKATSVIHYHANIHKALKYAVRIDLIPTNPADKVERPKKETFHGGFYDTSEMNQLIEAAQGERLELPILLGAFYGLRRSEILGLKWAAIDFESNTITIRHVVTTCHLDGKTVTVQKDRTKTKSSMRTLPLIPAFRSKLLEAKEQQALQRKLCGRSYNKQDAAYICVDPLGTAMRPGYVTSSFGIFLRKKGLRKIRFHDLRHSSGSLLMAQGYGLKEVQSWLGHANIRITADIYGHLEKNHKKNMANRVGELFPL